MRLEKGRDEYFENIEWNYMDICDRIMVWNDLTRKDWERLSLGKDTLGESNYLYALEEYWKRAI